MTIANKLNSILTIKNQIKAAIQTKGVTVSDSLPFSQYADKIKAISGVIDTTPPIITSFSIVANSDKSLTISGSTEAGATVVLKNPNSVVVPLTVNPNGTFSGTLAAVAIEGDYTLTVSDAAGNNTVAVKKIIFDPVLAIYNSGAKGLWFDPDDLSTMFQDSAGTIPVTAIGQTVGYMKCKINNSYWKNDTVSKQPKLMRDDTTNSNYLLFDGIDDHYTFQNTVVINTPNMSIFNGSIINNAANSPANFLEGSVILGLTNTYDLLSTSLSYGAQNLSYKVNSQGYVAVTSLPFKLITSVVLRAQGQDTVRGNGFITTGATKSLANFTTMSARQNTGIGGAGFRLYSLIMFDREATANEITTIETILSRKTGATISA